MGTKANPGQFDCYAAADDNEPMFILLGRDPFASDLVRLWAALREHEFRDAISCFDSLAQTAYKRRNEWNKSRPNIDRTARELDKINEARACALAMDNFDRSK